MNTLKKETYVQVSGFIFLVVAVVHGLRIVNEWSVVLNDWTVPLWASWIAVIVGLYLAYSSFNMKK